MSPYDFQYICLWISQKLRRAAAFFDVQAFGDDRG